jgi:hypothetical protein
MKVISWFPNFAIKFDLYHYIEAAAALEEALLGELAESRAPLPVRLQDAAAAAIIMQAEVATAQRGAREIEPLRAATAEKDAALEKQTEIARAAMKESLSMQKDNALLKDMLGDARNERNEQCKKAGGDPVTLYAGTGESQSTKTQMKYIETLEAKIKTTEGELTAAREATKKAEAEATKAAGGGAGAEGEMTMPVGLALFT